MGATWLGRLRTLRTAYSQYVTDMGFLVFRKMQSMVSSAPESHPPSPKPDFPWGYWPIMLALQPDRLGFPHLLLGFLEAQ